MDQERFDRITRTLASGQSRRGLLRGITGTALGGLLAAVGIADCLIGIMSFTMGRWLAGGQSTVHPSV